MNANITKPTLSMSLDAGTNALNAYHLVGQLLAVYGLIEKMSIQSETKSRWEAPEVSLLENIGEVFEVWNAIKDQGNYGIPVVESPAIRNKIERLSNRLDQIQKSINSWTSASKMPTVLMKCEVRWQKILDNFLDTNESCTVKFSSLYADSRNRQKLLNELHLYYESEKEAFSVIKDDSEVDLLDPNVV